MSNRTKIQLSKLENELVNNTEWILTKQSIINKVYLLLGELHKTFASILREDKIVMSVFNGGSSGKISKGENYLGLPYAILDYPAIFKKENVLAIRTMFWWGNFFSITLHVSGWERMQAINIPRLMKNLSGKDLFLCVNENEWDHNFSRANYLPMTEISSSILAEISFNKFLKISKKIDLKMWDEAPAFLENAFCDLMDIVKANFQACEKVP